MDDFENVSAAGANAQKKHLLQKLVKKVLIHDKRTVEVWYGLPVRALAHMAPRVGLEPTT